MKKISVTVVLVIFMLFSNSVNANIIFNDDFENDPSNWVCTDGELSKWSAGWGACASTPGFGGEWRMGPGRNGGNAVYSYKKSGVPNNWRTDSRKNIYSLGLREIYYRWYMKVPPAEEYNKAIEHGFKFNQVVQPGGHYIYHNARGDTFATAETGLWVNETTVWLPLVNVSDFNDGQWHCHEIRIKTNTTGQSNGIVQYWLDGVLEADHQNIVVNPSPGDFEFIIVGIANVSDSDWYQTEWSAVGFDDVVVSTEYIGPDEETEDPGEGTEPGVPETDGRLLFLENFENTHFGNRGWYDGSSTAVVSGGYEGNCLEWHWQSSNSSPDNFSTMRRLFDASDEVFIRMRLKFATDWIGHQEDYGGPHLFNILSTYDQEYGSLARSYLNVYMEFFSELASPYSIRPRFIIQDGQNINTIAAIPSDLTGITENRAVAGCNGSLGDSGDIVSCYDSGGNWYNGRFWTAAAAIPKNEWILIETYIKMNSALDGIAQANGIMRQWVNGEIVQSSEDIVYRTGEHPDKQWNQFVLAPFMGGSPVGQSVWLDELEIYNLSANMEGANLAPPTELRILD